MVDGLTISHGSLLNPQMGEPPPYVIISIFSDYSMYSIDQDLFRAANLGSVSEFLWKEP